jgi:hypothetical protein
LLDKGERNLSVVVRCNLLQIRSYDFDRFRFDDVKLQIEDRQSGNQDTEILFELKTPGFTTGLLSSSKAPCFENGFINSSVNGDPKGLLPTARLVRHDRGFYLVVADGKTGRLFFKETNKKNFEERQSLSVDDRLILKNLFTSSFDPSDVYWNYFLVTQATFFGYSCPVYLGDRAIDTNLLRELWKSSRPKSM